MAVSVDAAAVFYALRQSVPGPYGGYDGMWFARGAATGDASGGTVTIQITIPLLRLSRDVIWADHAAAEHTDTAGNPNALFTYEPLLSPASALSPFQRVGDGGIVMGTLSASLAPSSRQITYPAILSMGVQPPPGVYTDPFPSLAIQWATNLNGATYRFMAYGGYNRRGGNAALDAPVLSQQLGAGGGGGRVAIS